MSELAQAIAAYLEPLERSGAVDSDAQQRLCGALSALDNQRPSLGREVPVQLAELTYRACRAVDCAPDPQPAYDSMIDVTELAADALAPIDRRWVGASAVFEQPVIQYTYSIREGAFDAAAEQRLLDEIDKLDTSAPTIDSALASLLVDTIQLTWAQIGSRYTRRERERERVERSFEDISQAIIAALRGSAAPSD